MNPYDPPKSHTVSLPVEIDSAVIERLILADGTEDLVFSDVSDHQLYGRKHRQKLTGDVANRATHAGCDNIVYQSVLWWCFVFIPVVPLGVYAVISKRECDEPDGDGDQYRGIRLAWDWQQIGLQYAIVSVIIMSVTSLIAFRWLSAF